jgi:predicted metal-dependent phosphoesterase TrpH
VQSKFKVLPLLCVVCVWSVGAQAPTGSLTPGTRVLLDAHNAYPENGRYADRLQRALSTGVPVAIEQDLVWYRDPNTGVARSVVSHGAPLSGREPSLDEYFFETIAPLVERALRENRRETWPVVTLNLDFKTNEPEHHAAVWALLGKYESWLTTAPRSAGGEIAPLDLGPLLVLAGEADEQEQSFHDRIPVGSRLRLFGAVHSRTNDASVPREAGALPDLSPLARSNYRRWWNHPWSVVEQGGQTHAGEWTGDEERRLLEIVDRAHQAGLWIRFYTLNGHDPADSSSGWTASYNFGSRAAAELRWKAAIHAGVDFVAVDQYEDFARVLTRERGDGSLVELEGVLTRADYERLFEREFDVPPGTERIDLDLRYDDGNRTVIDLGLRGPSGFRGWNGGGQQQVFVSTHSASFGYTPGSIEPGNWAVILGVPNIREGVTSRYTVTARTSASASASGWPTLRSGAGWYSGDLHAHSGHSDGRTIIASGERVRVPPEHAFNAARAAGLDFMALTDHNTASHWADVDRFQPLYPGMLLLHAREVTTYRGHMNAFGERRFVDFRISDSRPMKALAAEIAQGGAVLSINHPLRPDDETCMGCGWNDKDDATIRVVHAVEIVNGGLADGPMAGWSFWAAMLNRGHHLTAIGGSDEHTPDETAEQRMGRPTTVVYARELSEHAIVEGIRAGRVYVRTRSPEGPTLDLWAESGSRRFELGETAPSGPLVLHAEIGRAKNNVFEWIRNGAVLRTGKVPADGRVRHEMMASAGDWFSLVLRDGTGATLYSSAIYTARP